MPQSLITIFLPMVQLWLITAPDDFSAEFDDIEEMFRRGLTRLILQKRGRTGAPHASEADYERWLLGLPMEFRDRIWVSGTPDLAQRLEVRGCLCDSPHLAGEIPPSWYRIDTVARCNAPEEIAKQPPWVSGALIGPVFQPMSTFELVSCIDLSGLKTDENSLNPAKIPLILSGGLDPDNLESIRHIAPAGIATLGGIWNYADPINAFIKMKRAVDALA